MCQHSSFLWGGHISIMQSSIGENVIILMSDKKRIFKNTTLLYIRQLFTLGLSLYTSRLTLQVLGADDFGIYAAVGGFTALLSILTSSMAGSGQRFLTFELGKGNVAELRRIFNTFLQLMLTLSFVLIFLAESVGVWFVNTYLTIPPERMHVALWVFQLSIFTCVINILNAPYNSVIVAHEDMGKFALFSIVDAILKLVFVALLFVVSWDKLLFYATSLMCIQLLDRIIMGLYCHQKYDETHLTFSLEKNLMFRMASFAGWTLLSNLSIMGFVQGVNVLLNICFGPVVNAAFTVANQAYSGIRSFCSSFQLAANPQIVKSYSEGKIPQLNELLLFVCKMSFFLIFVLSLPFLINADYIMRLWLVEVPPHAVGFFCILLVYAYVDVFAYPLDTAAQATGKLKTYTLRTSLLLFSVLPLGYLLFKLGLEPESIYVVAIVVGVSGLVVRLITLKQNIDVPLANFVIVFLRCVVVSVVSFTLAWLLHISLQETFVNAVLVFLFCLVESITLIYVLGLNSQERVKLKTIYYNKLKGK